MRQTFCSLKDHEGYELTVEGRSSKPARAAFDTCLVHCAVPTAMMVEHKFRAEIWRVLYQ